MFALLLSLTASAGGLDLLEVGGAWGTPGATNATATFWNPAGLGVQRGTDVYFEIAPTYATVDFERDHPDWGGPVQLKSAGVVPFIGASSDFGHAPLGVGMALSIPFARSATAQPDGPARFLVEEGGSQTIFGTLAAAYHIKKLVSVGASFSMVRSSWEATLDSASGTDLDAAMCQSELCGTFSDIGANGVPSGVDPDYWLEHDNYATQLEFQNLTASTYTFGGGIYVTPVEMLGVSISYMHGGSLSHTGNMTASTSCPSNDVSDEAYHADGFIGADLSGICNTEMGGDATVAYEMPWRLNTGIVAKIPGAVPLRVEGMGGYVGWSVYTDYDIDVAIDPDRVDLEDAADREAVAEIASARKLRARDGRNSYWLGVDAKASLFGDKLTPGLRLTYDKAAYTDEGLAANNYDANTVMAMGMVAYRPVKPLMISLSYTRYFMMTRVTTTSGHDITLNGAEANDERWFWPSSNGTYKGGLNRFGIALRGHFGG
jgi:long-subunit fatty acid transport protein